MASHSLEIKEIRDQLHPFLFEQRGPKSYITNGVVHMPVEMSAWQLITKTNHRGNWLVPQIFSSKCECMYVCTKSVHNVNISLSIILYV